jgi:hypothetical protein
MYTKKHNQKKNLLGRTEGIESAFMLYLMKRSQQALSTN